MSSSARAPSVPVTANETSAIRSTHEKKTMKLARICSIGDDPASSKKMTGGPVRPVEPPSRPLSAPVPAVAAVLGAPW